MIASIDDSSISSTTFTLSHAAAADAKDNKNMRHSVSNSSNTAVPSPDVDWLVAARRQQRVSPKPSKYPAATAASPASAPAVDGGGIGNGSVFVPATRVVRRDAAVIIGTAAADAAAADAAAVARREREIAVAEAIALTAASSALRISAAPPLSSSPSPAAAAAAAVPSAPDSATVITSLNGSSAQQQQQVMSVTCDRYMSRVRASHFVLV